LNELLGIYEALELRDGGSDYLGKGVSKVKIGEDPNP
jgi:enolase